MNEPKQWEVFIRDGRMGEDTILKECTIGTYDSAEEAKTAAVEWGIGGDWLIREVATRARPDGSLAPDAADTTGVSQAVLGGVAK